MFICKRDPGVVGCISVLLVNLEASRWSWCSLGFVYFICARPRGRRIHSRSFSEFGRTNGVVGFTRDCLVDTGVPKEPSVSFALVCFVPSGRRVHSGAFLVSVGSFGFVCTGPEGPRYIFVRLVNSVALQLPWGSFGLVSFIRARPGGLRVHSDSFGSFRRSPGVVGIIRDRLIHSRATRVSSGSFGLFGSLWRAPGVAGFIRVRLVNSGMFG